MMKEDTIAAVATPVGEGGIGIIRVSGPDALRVADALFVPKRGKKPSGRATHTVLYGHIVDASGRPADEALLAVMRAPRTYTKEDVVEFNCHGGIQATKRVLDLVLAQGARLAEPGEFTRRAFLNGRIDLAQAEAVLDVIRSKTEGSLKVAVRQLGGELSREVDALRTETVAIAAEVEAAIDFPDEDLEIMNAAGLAKRAAAVIERLEDLADSYGEGAVLREGVLAIICGKPNVGKSSLMNLLLKRDRVIVSPVPGTTRDVVEETISLRGIPVRLVDTAGIAKGRGRVEREGIRRSRDQASLADIALFVLDATTGITVQDRAIAKLLGAKKKLVIVNKIDAGKKLTAARAAAAFPGEKVIAVSVAAKKNIKALEDAVAGLIWGGAYSQGEGAIVSNARHKALLDKALANMVSVRRLLEEGAPADIVAVDLREAIMRLGLMTGKEVADDVLDRIFERFCIGK